MRRLIAWFDDAINPIVVKELRQAVKSRFVIATLLLFLAVQLGWFVMHLLVFSQMRNINSLEYQGGPEAFIALQYILLATCLLFIPLYTAVRLAAERNEVNVDLLYITTIQPRSIIAGKLASALALAVLIFSLCMPFMGLTYYLRGLDWTVILFVLAFDFLVVMMAVQSMVFLAVIPCNIVLRVILGLIALYCLGATYFGVVELSREMLRFDFFRETSQGFYAFVAFVGWIVGMGALLFSFSVAIVSPPSSNRTLWPRIVMLLVSGISGGVFAWLCTLDDVRGEPFCVWIWFSTALASLAMLIAINERREYPPRIARRIPSSALGRLFAFPFFGGAAGGIVFALLLAGMTLVAGAVFRIAMLEPMFLRMGGPLFEADPFYDTSMHAAAMMFLYMYCYGLTAVFLQRTILRRIAPIYTWVIALLLLGLGMVVPYIISYWIHLDQWTREQNSIWLITNPFVTLYEVMRYRTSRTEYRDLVAGFWLFLGAWTCIVTLLNLRWFGTQLASFRRRIPPLPPDFAMPDVAVSDLPKSALEAAPPCAAPSENPA